MPRFSSASRRRLNTCHPALVAVCERVIRHYNFSVLEGRRPEERQNMLHAEGRSQVQWPNSKHNAVPPERSEAVDIAPYPIDWDDRSRFAVLAGRMMQAFDTLQDDGAIPDGLTLRWGGDWDRDDHLDDNDFDDLPHFELIRTDG